MDFVVEEKKDLRMVCLVLYNLSPIQQGIQSAHAIVEYGLMEGSIHARPHRFVEWASKHKTIIILNGGTTITMNQYRKELEALGVTFATFQEPDLGDITTSISFIVDYRNEPHIVKYLKHARLA